MVDLDDKGRPKVPIIVNTTSHLKLRRLEDGEILKARVAASKSAKSDGVGRSARESDVDSR